MLSPPLSCAEAVDTKPLENPPHACTLYYMPGEHEREQVKSDQAQTEESDDRYTAFGYALFCLVLALFLFAAPSYFSIGSVVGSMFGKSVGSMVGTVTSIICYIAAVIFAFYTASFTLSAFDKHPELKPYLRHLFGGSADAWDSAFGALTFVGIALIVHLAAFVVFGVSGIASVVLKAFVYFIAFMGFILGVSALDSFVFEPFLRNLSDRPDRRALPGRAKKIAVAVGSVIVSIATLLAALNELLT